MLNEKKRQVPRDGKGPGGKKNQSDGELQGPIAPDMGGVENLSAGEIKKSAVQKFAGPPVLKLVEQRKSRYKGGGGSPYTFRSIFGMHGGR